MGDELTLNDSSMTEAEYLACRSVADTHQARQLLIDWPNLPLQVRRQLYYVKAHLISMAMGNSVAESIYRSIYGKEPYEGLNWNAPSGEELLSLLLEQRQ